jgi:hypothetical protein
MQKPMRKMSTRLLGVLLALLLGINLNGAVRAANLPGPQSPALQQMLNQMEQVFLAPRGLNISAVIQHPPTFALLMGIMFQSQVRYARQNPQLTAEFNRLENEALDTIQRVARMYNYQGRLPELMQLVRDGAGGKMDLWVRQNYGVNPAALQMPSLLGPPSQQRAKIWTGKDDGSVSLLGQKAPHVATPNIQTTRPGVVDLNAEVNQLKSLQNTTIKGFPYIPPGHIDLKKGSRPGR